MRKVIKGRLYDTSTARLIGESKGVALYGTKTGCYFVAQGPSILPLTREQAVQWSVSELGSDLTAPPPREAQDTVTISLTVTEKALLEQLASDADMTISAYVRARCL